MKKGWYTDDFDKIKTKIEVDGCTYDEIAEEYGVEYHNVQSFVSRFKLNYIGRKIKREDWTVEEINLLKTLVSQGKTLDEIGKFFKNRNRGSISSLIIRKGKELGIFVGSGFYTVPEEVKKEILSKYKKDISIKNLSLEYGISPINIEEMLIKFGIDLRENHLSKDDLTKDFLYTELILNKKSISDLSRDTGISFYIISDLIEKYGLNKNNSKEKKDKESFLKKKELLEKFLKRKDLTRSEIFTLKLHECLPKEFLEGELSKGKSMVDISNDLGLSPSTISKSARFHGIKFSKIKDFSLEFWKDVYVEKQKSYNEISEITGLSVGTVCKYLNKIFPDFKYHEGFLSIWEKLISEVLKDLKIDFKYSYFCGLDVYKGHKVFIDFVVEINNTTYWIEYNGQQHYQCIPKLTSYLGDPNRFLRQIERDNCIRNYCKNNSIILIEIPYTVKTRKKIKSILENILLKNKSPELIIDLSRHKQEIKQSLELIKRLEKEDQV